MRDIPYLNGVKAFEAAARLGGFAAAARELNVTPAAVSRMVRLLEARMGVALFERAANRLAPTPAGRACQAGLAQIFDQLETLARQVKTIGGSRVLTVGVGPSFAIRWLIPRLANFHESAPDIEVRVTTGGVAAPFADDWSCGIKLGDGDWPGLVAEPLFQARLVPVCAPALARRLTSPGRIASATLLRVAHAPQDWPLWLGAAGLSGIVARGPRFEYYDHALRAASDSVGVALGIRPYIDDDLKAGRLVAPFKISAPKGSGWYLVYRKYRAGEPAFEAFHKWIARRAKG